MHQIRPLVPRELNCRDRSNNLGSGLARLGIGGGERLERQLLDACLGILICLLKPFCLERCLSRELACREGILQSNTSGGSNVTLRILVRELLDERQEVL